MTLTNYYFVLASKNFLLVEEPLEEVLRERIKHYQQQNITIDFWMLPNPSFFDAPQFEDIRKNCPKETIAIISTNKIFIEWLKLRLNNVYSNQFVAPSADIPNPLGYTKTV
jgi:hypothetical protein